MLIINKYNKLVNYLLYIKEKYNLHICIKDYVGFISVDKELDEALLPFLTHSASYCMYIKQDKKLYYSCLSMMRPMVLKSEKIKSSFYGVCFAGVGEYIIPIFSDNDVIGSINVGFFHPNLEVRNFLIKRLCRKSTLIDESTAQKLYDSSITKATIKDTEVLNILEFVSEYLSFTYTNLLSTHQGTLIGKKKFNSNESYILANTLDYINANFRNKILVKDIAGFSHCCESYINHIFKKRIGVSISTYINKMRVESSKELLLSTSKSINEISYDVGFSDANYFSKVFCDLTSIPPSEFRRRYS